MSLRLTCSKPAFAALAALTLTSLARPVFAQVDLIVAGEDATTFKGHIYRYSSTGVFKGFFTSGGPALDGPSSMVKGPDGNVYVLSGSDTVYRYNGTTGHYIDTFIPSGTAGLTEAKNIAFGPDGNLYIAANASGNGGVNSEGGQVLRFNGSTGAFINTFIATDAGGTGTSRLDEAMSLAFGKDGNLYVGNDARQLDPNFNNAYNVLRFNASTGAFVDTLVPNNDHGLYDPNALVFGPDGNLYVSNEGNSTFPSTNSNILRYNPTTGLYVDTFVTDNSGGLAEPYGTIFGADGNFYVTSTDTGQVKRYDGTTGSFVDTFVNSGNLADPKALLFVTASAPSTPEPGSLALLASLGLTGVGLLARRRRRTN